jgi:hypothetical protein
MFLTCGIREHATRGVHRRFDVLLRPPEIRRALAQSLLAAWMDKTAQYPIKEYLPIMSLKYDYAPRYEYSDISGGRVWEAAGLFRAAGI